MRPAAVSAAAVFPKLKARLALSQLYAKQQKHVVFEVKVPGVTATATRQFLELAPGAAEEDEPGNPFTGAAEGGADRYAANRDAVQNRR